MPRECYAGGVFVIALSAPLKLHAALSEIVPDRIPKFFGELYWLTGSNGNRASVLHPAWGVRQHIEPTLCCDLSHGHHQPVAARNVTRLN